MPQVNEISWTSISTKSVIVFIVFISALSSAKSTFTSFSLSTCFYTFSISK